MLQLGMDAEGAELRAKMQSASLLSDMESFKAANPGSILADFVRWHSPRDWEESADRKSKVEMHFVVFSSKVWRQ
jgi:Rab3 GTPase-activating protein catalytic subunit